MNQMLVKLAWANLFRNRKRNALSFLAVTLGFLGMSLFFDYVAWAERWMSTISIYLNHNGHVTVYKEGALDKYFSRPRRYLVNSELKTKVFEIAKADPRVEMVGGYLKAMGLVTRQGVSTAFLAQGVDMDIEQRVVEHPQVQQWSSEFLKLEYQGNLWGHQGVDTPVAVTNRVGKLLGYSFATTDGPKPVGDVQLVATTFEGGMSALDGQIVSRFSTSQALSEETGLMTSLTGLQKLYDTDGVSSIAIYLKDRGDLASFYKDFSGKLKAENIPLQALPFYDEKISPFYVGVTQFIYAAATLFLVLVSLVVVISLANTMSMAVVERTREIGTMRSIGYLPSHVARLFMMEGTFLVGIGMSFGLVLNHVVSFLVNHYTNFRFAPPGISGDAQFLVITNWRVSAFLAVVFLIMGLASIASVVKRRTGMAVAQLFQGN